MCVCGGSTGSTDCLYQLLKKMFCFLVKVDLVVVCDNGNQLAARGAVFEVGVFTLLLLRLPGRIRCVL